MSVLHKIVVVAFFAGMTAGTSICVQADTAPSRRMEIPVPQDELAKLSSTLSEFAQKESFSFEDIGARMPFKDNRPVFYVRLIKSDSNEITATNFLEQNRVLLFHYPSNQGNSFEEFDKLINELRRKWPQIHPYSGL